jgi:hypothetical protein
MIAGLILARRFIYSKLKQHEKFITTLSSVFIALFTVVLAFATYFLYSATRDLVIDADENAKRQLRAYVTMKSVEEHALANLNRNQPQAWVFLIVWQNTGATPANNLATWNKIKVFESDASKDFNCIDPTNINGPIGGVIGPNAFQSTGKLVLSAEDILKMQRGLGKAYISGRIEYNDVFVNTRHHTDFCAELELINDPSVIRDGATPFAFRILSATND